MPTTVYISGVQSGPSPAPGIGIARSVRAAYPTLLLVGVDYAHESSGLHSDLFDDVWVAPPWSEIDLPTHVRAIRTALEGENFWLSGSDLEISALAREGVDVPSLLIPPVDSLEAITKPSASAARALPVQIPDSISTDVPDPELHAFLRRHDWRVWLKGPHYGAWPVSDWSGFCRQRREFQRLWRTNNLLLQGHVAGTEESIAFCAYRGVLISCVRMEKRVRTLEGKTWAGRIEEVPPDLLSGLRATTAALNWTGGGELEFVRDARGALNLIDWNPRFPAWIHAATLSGVNLPARLLDAAGAGASLPSAAVSREFTRIVIEIPARFGLPLPIPTSQDAFGSLFAKHPSGISGLVHKAEPSLRRVPLRFPPASPELQEALARLRPSRTPARLLVRDQARRSLQKLSRIAAEPIDGVKVRFAYSVKTNPHRRFMHEVHEAGLLAEVISRGEARHAIACGFSPDKLVVNGPLAGLVTLPRGRMRAWFADSLEALERRVREGGPAACFAGSRLRLPGVLSRFGIDVSDPDSFQALTELLRKLPPSQKPGLHFHVASDAVGAERWRRLWAAFLVWAETIEESIGRPIACLDVGGGWFPDEFDVEYLPKVRDMIIAAKQVLPFLEELIVEPGKAIAQPCMVLVTTVVELRQRKTSPYEAIVDAGISDLPLARRLPHRILARGLNGHWIVLPAGDDRILGRLCMEDDVLAQNVSIPQFLQAGDRLVFTDAGGYDASMAYDFGRGKAL